MAEWIYKEGFFAKSFPVDEFDSKKIRVEELPIGLGDLSEHFKFGFENSGVMVDGTIYTIKTAARL